MIPKYVATYIHSYRKDVKLTLGKTYDVIFFQKFVEPHQISIIRDDGKERYYNAKWFHIREKDPEKPR